MIDLVRAAQDQARRYKTQLTAALNRLDAAHRDIARLSAENATLRRIFADALDYALTLPDDEENP